MEMCYVGVLLALCSANALAASYTGKVLLVSMDGFRWDYLNRVPTPNFDAFAERGVKLQYMNNSFVTKTFPNHYTLVTGLFEESHGITENAMYDPLFNSTFSMSNKEPRWWDGGEPIWVTAKTQGLKTGTYFWPGSEVEIRGVRPDYWIPYSDSTPYETRIDTVIDWFKTKEVHLATLYFPEPDHSGHEYGPESKEVSKKITDMDGVLGSLMSKLKKNGLSDVNVIMTSDHGMTTIDVKNKVIDITKLIDMAKVQRIPSQGPVMQILPVDGQIDAIMANLTNVEHITAYKKENLPERFHYKNHRRIMPVIVIADQGWMITDDAAKLAKSDLKGTHGFDNSLSSMKPIFLAQGPNFKFNMTSEPIKNVDIYPLMCQLLKINPSQNNGSRERVAVFTMESDTSAAGSPLYKIINKLVLTCFALFISRGFSF